ncbi:MAG: GTP-binding protein, partial [Firmicutes bacterium]|nr:GTP-binding protein [Bacillota bacterium]
HHHHHDHDDDDDDECCCGHDHEHHHHDHDEEGHEHHHHHHHGHDADEVFTSWGAETTHRFTKEGLEAILEKLDSSRFGLILRAKGIVQAEDGSWLHFDYVPEEIEVRQGPADYTGRLCVIGSKLDEESLKELFGL